MRSEYKVIENMFIHKTVESEASKFGMSVDQYCDLFLQWVGLCAINNQNWKNDGAESRFNLWLKIKGFAHKTV